LCLRRSFVRWPYIRDVYIAEPSYLVSAAALLWAWLAGWLAYSYARSHFMVAAFGLAGLLSFWTQAKYFGIVDFTSGAANVLAWLLTLWVVFFDVGIAVGDRAKFVLNYLGEISFPLYLIHYPVLFALTSSVFKAHPDWNYGIVQVVIALVCAVLTFHLVDRPLRFGLKRAQRPDISFSQHGRPARAAEV
jgi:peptidoglycan/LPS O-acetylase OafA/YrhL